MKKMKTFTRTLLYGAGTLALLLVTLSCVNSNGKDGQSVMDNVILTGEAGFEQAELPYAFDALEPVIDAQTMELHYGKHHAGYTRKFNAALNEEGIATTDIKEIFANVSSYSANVRNNGGGYYNHSLFWNFMSPDGGGTPSGDLAAAIERDFGSFEEFKSLFSAAAGGQFGSGWAWLIIDEQGTLKVTSTSNQDNPLMDIAEVKGTPLLNLDVWEHAYYLNYQNERGRYIENFWKVVNWPVVEKLYEEAAG